LNGGIFPCGHDSVTKVQFQASPAYTHNISKDVTQIHTSNK